MSDNTEVAKIEPKTQDVVKFSHSTEKLKKLAVKYDHVTTAEGPENYKKVMAGLADYRAVRVDIDNEYKEKNADILAAGRNLRAKRDKLKGIIQEPEDRLKEIRQIEDVKAQQAETARVAELDARVNAIYTMTREEVEALVVDESFQEQQLFAQGAVNKRLIELAEAERIEAEQRIEAEKQAEAAKLQKIEDERLAKERAELEKQRQEQDERDRKAREAQEAIDAKQKAAQEKIDADRRALEEEKAANERKKQEEAEAKEREAEAQREADAKAAQEADAKARRDKDIAEAKAAALAALPDIDKARAYIDVLLAVEVPDVKDELVEYRVKELRRALVNESDTFRRFLDHMQEQAHQDN